MEITFRSRQDRSFLLRPTIWMPHTAQGLIDSRMGHPTDSKRSRSVTANCGLYRSASVATGYCPARSHLLHAIANASARVMTLASVQGHGLQILNLGSSTAMPHSTPIRWAAFRTMRPSAARLLRHDCPARRNGRSVRRKRCGPQSGRHPAAVAPVRVNALPSLSPNSAISAGVMVVQVSMTRSTLPAAFRRPRQSRWFSARGLAPCGLGGRPRGRLGSAMALFSYGRARRAIGARGGEH
jgi:hypothetical protein